MKLNKLFSGMLLLAVSSLASMTASAEIGGLLNGRSADLNKLPDTSVELGINFGEIYNGDYQYFGVRYNYRINPDFMAYADLGSMEVEEVDEFGFGFGAFYMMHDVIATADTAVKFSFHNVGGDLDINILAIEALVSGRNGLGSNPDLQWYANIGINRLSGDRDSDTELLLGFGLAHPTQSGEVFGGIDLIDDMQFGIGYRHFL